jgi:hypothetical protein
LHRKRDSLRLLLATLLVVRPVGFLAVSSAIKDVLALRTLEKRHGRILFITMLADDKVACFLVFRPVRFLAPGIAIKDCVAARTANVMFRYLSLLRYLSPTTVGTTARKVLDSALASNELASSTTLAKWKIRSHTDSYTVGVGHIIVNLGIGNHSWLCTNRAMVCVRVLAQNLFPLLYRELFHKINHKILSIFKIVLVVYFCAHSCNTGWEFQRGSVGVGDISFPCIPLTIQCPVLDFIHRDLEDLSFKEKWAAIVAVTIHISKVFYKTRVCIVIEQLFLIFLRERW